MPRGNYTGIVSGLIEPWMPDEPDMRGKRVVFDPQVDARTTQLLKDWTGNRSSWKGIFSDWLKDFNAQTPEVESNVAADNDYLKWIRDGGLERNLSGLRVAEGAADRTGMKNALDFADNQSNAANILTGAGGRSSSADYARRLKVGNRIASEFAGRDTARTRADLGNVINLKLSTQGRINANLAGLLSRKLQPQQLSDMELRELTNALGSITNIRNAVSQPVIWRERGSLEKTADVLDSFATSAYKGASAYATFSGMGGGGMAGGAGGAGGTPGASGSMSAPQDAQWMREFNGTPQVPVGGGGGYQSPQFNSAPMYQPMMQYQQPPNYSPGNDPNFWQRYGGTPLG